jgi:6-phosphogluconolactonase (cycloisomerase 2 family)
MKARTISALCGIITAAAACAAFVTGCASGHKQFVYVVGQGTNEVFEFRAQPDGKLTPLGAPNFPAGSNPAAVAVHTSGDFLYIADFGGNDVTLLDINKSNGNLSVPTNNSVIAPVTPPNVFSTDGGPVSLAMSPAHPFLFVANQSTGDVTVFAVDPGTGSLGQIAGSPFAIAPASNPHSLAVTPKGDFLFLANPAQGTVAAFAIGSNGALTAAPGSPFAMGAGATPNSVTIEHTGRFLYVADTAHNAVLGFSIGSNGGLTAISGSPFAAGTQPLAVAADPQGTLLFTANSGSNNVSAYVISASTGALGQVTGSPFATGGQGPSALGVSADSTVLYVADGTTNDIAELAIRSDGTLKPLAGSPVGVAASGTSIALVVR